MVAITIANVWKYYGDVPAVRELNLTSTDGEFVSVLGPSGCGKSSTMRMLAGLEHISAGTIAFGSQVVNSLPPKDRDIAMVFENYALYPHKTVFENIANPLLLAKVKRSEIETRVKQVAALLEIEHLLQRRPSELSGGQKQRTAIGRAIVRQPKVFLFDEPIAHLDAKLRARMRGELKHLQRQIGVTTIYVTHDQLEALSMADRIAVMHDGVLQQFDTPANVYNRPVNAWVATFVGEPSMNLLKYGMTSQNGAMAFGHPAFALPVDAALQKRLTTMSSPDVLVGVRPSDLKLSRDAMRDAVKATIFATELLGSDMLVELNVGADRVRVLTEPDFSGDMGDSCWITVDQSRLHVFSVETGAALCHGAAFDGH
jgi:multiple sugar transport system ATP-binding protein